MYRRLEVNLKKNKFKKILGIGGKILEWGVFFFIFAVFLAVAAPLLPVKNTFRTYLVTSGSMEPAIKAGSLALIKPVPLKNIKQNDIIVFSSPEDQKKEILHRVEAIVRDDGDISFKTRGDNNNAPDNWLVPAFSVKGVMLTAIPYLGHPVAMMRTPEGFALFMGLPALLLVFLFIRQIIDGVDEEIKKRVRSRAVVFILAALIPFNLVLIGSETVTALLSSAATVSGISLTVKDFVPPDVPQLLLPENNSTRNTFGMVMDWTDETDWNNMSPPVYYIYQSARNSGFSPLAYQSGHLANSQIPAPGTPDGVYWWRVKACDQIDNCSNWSEVWKVTVDSLAKLQAELSADGENVSFTLSNLFGYTSYHYELTYDTDGPPQGVNGTVTLSGEGESSREIYLGTCSSGGTCTPHTGINNLKLAVDVYKGSTVYHLEKIL